MTVYVIAEGPHGKKKKKILQTYARVGKSPKELLHQVLPHPDCQYRNLMADLLGHQFDFIIKKKKKRSISEAMWKKE